MELYELIAIVCACAMFITLTILAKYKPSIEVKFLEYMRPAMLAFKWVEANVSDEYGANEDDPKFAKAIHKGDLFLKKFTEFCDILEKPKPTTELIAHAEALAVKLAEKQKVVNG